jgi:hypothetical protein
MKPKPFAAATVPAVALVTLAFDSRKTVRQQQGGLGAEHKLNAQDTLDARAYAGSVIVNESNRRFFEPAPGRRFFAGLRISI